jgi:hypothetical protein
MMDSPGILSLIALATVRPPIPESNIPKGREAAEIIRGMIKDKI